MSVTHQKRKMDEIEDDEDTRIPCKYGSKCYQKNKAHHEKYKHPSENKDTKEEQQSTTTKKPCTTSSLKQQKLNFIFKKKQVKTETTGKNEEKGCLKEENTLLPVSSEPSFSSENLGKCSPFVNNSEESNSCIINISKEDASEIIKELFLVEMPDDFYSFWSFCRSLFSENPTEALKSVDLTLVGPFDVLAGTLKKNSASQSKILTHWRYYYDPPEFQTIMKSSKDDFHMGYFRDDPDTPPVFVAYNEAAKNSFISHIAENLFGAVDWYLNRYEKSINPFQKIKSSNLRSSLHNWAKKHGFTLEKNTPKMQERNKATVCKTFHQAGIVVPFDKKTQLGYRPLSETPNNLKKLLNKIENACSSEERIAHFNALYTIVNWANIAMDEGDFGTNLELGLSLFSYGTSNFDSIILSTLENAYNFLNRQAFAVIIKAHLENRKKGGDLSVISENKK